MLLAKKLLMGDVNTYMFIYPIISSSGRRIASDIYYITKDGINLTKCTFPSASLWINPVYGHKKYITFATGSSSSEVYSSPDGKTWTYKTSLSGVSSARLFFDGEYFYAFTTANGSIYRSSDGSSWTSIGTVPAMMGTFSGHTAGLAYRNGTFVIGCWNSTDYRADIWYSTNGCVSWTQVTIPNYNPTSRRTLFRGLAAGSDGFAIAFSDTTSNAINLFYSSNGSSWSKSTLAISTGGATELIDDGKYIYTARTDSGAYSGYKSSGDGNWSSITLGGLLGENGTADVNQRYFCTLNCATGATMCSKGAYNVASGVTGSGSQTLVVPTSSYSTYYYGYARTCV